MESRFRSPASFNCLCGFDGRQADALDSANAASRLQWPDFNRRNFMADGTFLSKGALAELALSEWRGAKLFICCVKKRVWCATQMIKYHFKINRQFFTDIVTPSGFRAVCAPKSAVPAPAASKPGLVRKLRPLRRFCPDAGTNLLVPHARGDNR